MYNASHSPNSETQDDRQCVRCSTGSSCCSPKEIGEGDTSADCSCPRCAYPAPNNAPISSPHARSLATSAKWTWGDCAPVLLIESSILLEGSNQMQLAIDTSQAHVAIIAYFAENVNYFHNARHATNAVNAMHATAYAKQISKMSRFPISDIIFLFQLLFLNSATSS